MIVTNKIIKTYRMTTNGSGTYSGSTTLSGIECLINPAQAELANNYSEIPAKNVYLFVTEGILDLKEGDKIENEANANEYYIVKAVMFFNDVYLENTQAVLDKVWGT